MRPFIDLQMLQDATRRLGSSKATKQTRTRRCKTFKWCEMLLEDEGDETRPRVASTRHHRALLLKYYMIRPCAHSFVKSRMLRLLQTHFLLFQQIFFVLVCIHPGLLGCVLGFWSRGQNPTGAIVVFSSPGMFLKFFKTPYFIIIKYIFFLSLAEFIVKRLLKLNTTLFRIQTGRRLNSWLFTSVAEDLNSRTQWNKSR